MWSSILISITLQTGSPKQAENILPALGYPVMLYEDRWPRLIYKNFSRLRFITNHLNVFNWLSSKHPCQRLCHLFLPLMIDATYTKHHSFSFLPPKTRPDKIGRVKSRRLLFPIWTKTALRAIYCSWLIERRLL